MFCERAGLKVFSQSFCAAIKRKDSHYIDDAISKEGLPAQCLPHVVDFHKRSLLHLASANGNVRMTRFLIKIGCPLDTQDYLGNTPLLLASYYGHVRVAKMLMNAGATPTIPNDDGNTAIYYSMLHLDMPRVLAPAFKSLDAEHLYFLSQQLIKAKLHLCDVKLNVNRQLNHGGRFNAIAHPGIPPSHATSLDVFGPADDMLHQAILLQDEFQVKICLLYFTESKTMVEHGCAALHFAAALTNDDGAIINRLLKCGAGVDQYNANGIVPLHVACIFANYRTAKQLVDNRARVDLVDFFGRTALDILLSSDSLCDGCRGTDVSRILWLLHAKGVSVNEATLTSSQKWDKSVRQTKHHVLLKHLALVEVHEGERMPKNHLAVLRDNQCCSDYYDACRDELELIRKTVVEGPVAMLRFLVEDDERLVPYVENLNIKRNFDMANVRQTFPIYGDVLQARFDDAWAEFKRSKK